mgnify:CR=1 FL=1
MRHLSSGRDCSGQLSLKEGDFHLIAGFLPFWLTNSLALLNSKLFYLISNRLLFLSFSCQPQGATAEKDYVKIPKIGANCATGPNGTNSQQQQQSANQNHNHNSHQNQPIYQQKLGRKETEELKSPPPPLISSVPTFRRFSRSNSITNSNQQNGLSGQLPRFHFPNGRPYSSHEVETQIRRIIAVFERFPSRSVTRKDLGGVLKLVGIPVYWKEPLFCAVVASAKANGIGGSQQSLSNGNGVAGVLNGGRARSGSRSNSIDLSAAGPLANGALAATLKKEYISCEQFTDYWRR